MGEPQHSPFQYSLRTLFELTTITALLFGVGVMAPWLGIMLAVLVAPGIVRFCYCDVRTSVRGKPLIGIRRIRLLLIDVGIGAWIGVCSAAIAFATFARYNAGADGPGLNVLFVASIAIAIGAGVATFSYLSWYSWFRAPN
jgi:hypothetical protein